MKKKLETSLRTLLHLLYHPIFIFVLLQIVWVTITLLWVFWFVDETEEIARLAKSFGGEHFNTQYALVIMIVGCILLGVLLVGTVVLFIFGQHQSYQRNQQRNFLSSVTHELRSPLSGLRLSVETLQKRQVSRDTKAELLSMAMIDIDRLSRLINQILISARLDKGLDGFKEDAEDFEVKAAVLKIINRFKWLDPLVENRVHIKCVEGMQVYMPSVIFTFILSNLLENALKYSPKNTPIDIIISKSPSHFIMEVKDKGFGLQKKEISRIFKIFYRAKIAKKKAINGTGVGLFIVKSLVRVLRGKIEVSSAGLDEGSIFLVSFPLKNLASSSSSRN